MFTEDVKAEVSAISEEFDPFGDGTKAKLVTLTWTTKAGNGIFDSF